MFGFVFGTLCLVGLIKVLRHGHAFHGEHGPACRSPGRFGGARAWGGGRRWMLRRLFERLETMPGQERAILEALDRLAESRGLVRDELAQTRADVAKAIEHGFVDDTTLDDTFARHDRAVAQLRVSAVEALKTCVEVLDERQRQELARLIAGRGFFGGAGRWGGYSSGVWA